MRSSNAEELAEERLLGYSSAVIYAFRRDFCSDCDACGAATLLPLSTDEKSMGEPSPMVVGWAAVGVMGCCEKMPLKKYTLLY